MEFTQNLPLIPTVEGMAGAYIRTVSEFRPGSPHVLAGMCSTGAYIAYEMAQQARAFDADIELLILFDPTNSEVAQKSCSPGRLLTAQAQEVLSRASIIPSIDADVPALKAQLAELILELGLDEGLLRLPPQRLHRFLEVFASNHDASLRYVPQPYNGRTEIFVPALSLSDDRMISGEQWKALIPLAEVHSLPIHREELYTDAETIAYISAVLRSSLH
jgi:thioesterase domain-containing protein